MWFGIWQFENLEDYPNPELQKTTNGGLTKTHGVAYELSGLEIPPNLRGWAIFERGKLHPATPAEMTRVV
jgi:hypothetical protein